MANSNAQQPRRTIGSQRQRFTSIPSLAGKRIMPRVGKLKLGIIDASTAGKQHPKEIDYFRVAPDEGWSEEERTKLVDSFHAVYGERPSRLHEVYLPSNDLEFTFPHPLQWWGQAEHGPKLLCEGNGTDAVRLDYDTGAWVPRACCQAAECAEFNGKKCSMRGRVRVFLPLVTATGYWQIDTGSEIGAGNILDVTQHLLRIFGRLTNIPFVLTREKEGVPYKGKVTPHWILHLWAPNVSVSALREIVEKKNALAITAGDSELVEPDPDNDLPDELISESEQEPAADPELLKKITAGFEILGTSQANRDVKLNQYKGHEAKLLLRINAEIEKRQPEKVGETS